MCRMIKLVFAVLLFLNNISQIIGSNFFEWNDEGIHGNLVNSERHIIDPDYYEIQNEIVEMQKELAKFIRHLKKDDQITAFNIHQIILINEGEACLKDFKGSEYFNLDYGRAFAKIYPAAQYQYDQLLEKLDNADQILFKELIDKTKTIGFKWYKYENSFK
ncbi:unnamed protein product [Rotaria sordida]|uniref:Uncharacterized protein n=1 Tax=Rotaria sordida TaxID=392033 RepID=A0A814SYC5_9BILA|nr:unnamed protein product [Rotaria sordida]